MSTTVHGIIRIDVERDWSSATARARCACGDWRQAAAYKDYHGEAGATLLVTRKFGCVQGAPVADLSARQRSPRPRPAYPASPESVERGMRELGSRSASLRTEAARLIRLAEEYEAGSALLSRDLAALREGSKENGRE